MNRIKEKWLKAIGIPSFEIPHEKMTLIKRYEYDEFDLEMYMQKNGPDTFQRVAITFPKNISRPCPSVVVPFYFPEAMLGFNPETDEILEKYKDIHYLVHLAKRGYIAISAEAYYLTYIDKEIKDEGFNRWRIAAEKLRKDNPDWSGIGKLVSDTKLLIDALCEDSRVDSSRIGITGHSLGGKMAFYTGCLDERIKVIVASDFGIRWDQTNWRDIWYWGDYVDILEEKGMDHAELLGAVFPKPFCLIAGEFDNNDSWDMMCKAPGYSPDDGRIKIINHATGHRPPKYALEESYDFFKKWL